MIGDRHKINKKWYVEKEETRPRHCSGCAFVKLDDCPYKYKDTGECKTIFKQVKEEVMLDYKMYVGNEEVADAVIEKGKKFGFEPYSEKTRDNKYLYFNIENKTIYGIKTSSLSGIKRFEERKGKEISFHEFLELPEPKQEKTIKIEGKDFTIERLKKMIEEAE